MNQYAETCQSDTTISLKICFVASFDYLEYGYVVNNL